MKGIKENQILVVIKEPGQAPRVEPLFDNTLEAFKEAVGGWVEAVTIADDLVIICNEEGRLRGLPFNTIFAGIPLVGTFLIVGTAGEEFTDVPEKYVPQLLRAL